MRISSSSLRQVFDRNQVPLQDRSNLTVLALAKAVAFHLPLPTSKVENLPKYYGETHQEFVHLALGGVNEAMVIDVGLANELTYKLYKLRYLMVFDATSVDAIKVFEAVAADGGRTVPAAFVQMTNTYGASVLAQSIKAMGDDLERSGVFTNG